MWHVYTMEYYLAMNKWILPFETTWMDIKGITLNEISQKQILRSYLYMGSKTKTKQTHRKRSELLLPEVKVGIG